MVERLHRQLKDAICARGGANTWAKHLPWVLLGIRATPKDESGISGAEAALGLELRMPGQLPTMQEIPTRERLHHGVTPLTKRTYAETVKGISHLERADWVYVWRGGQGRPLEDNYAGPYRVLEKSKKTFKVQLGQHVEVISRDRLKPHKGKMDPEPAKPPRRGCPPASGSLPV